MLEKQPETGFQRELIDINKEFLSLITDSSVAAAPEVLGLTGQVLASLRGLTPAELNAIATAPLLLAEFTPLPGLADPAQVAEQPALPAGIPARWQRDAEGFANRLLACIWQAARHENLLTALCIGIEPERYRQLAALSFRTISQRSELTLRCLRVRLAAHPNFWNELISMIRHGSESQQAISRLAMIPLSVAHSGLPTTTSDHPRYF